ncbi:MAG TPA: ATPase domain-containing protein [Pyrinomonadaceae bacterium]|nr:ATPase domain-containing protein [Pyrinomonadaceae bacterium]
MTSKTLPKINRKPAAPAKLSTGIEGLDDILEGGLPENHIYLAEGEPGTGKTTFSLQFLLEGVRQGETALYVTLSETKNELIEVAASHGWSLEKVNIFELIPSGESLKPESQYTIFHPSEIELNETTAAILEEVERLNPSRVVFDSLSEMRLLARDPLRYRRQILALKQYFAPRNCTVLLLDDKTSDTKDLQVQSIVHGVVTLEHLAVELCAERRRLRVVKLRGTHFRGGHHDFKLETGGICVFPRLAAAEYEEKISNETIKSEIAGLEEIIGGGFETGTSTLLIGPAGVGKSSLATKTALAAAENKQRAAIFVFDELRETYIARAEGLGADIRKYIKDGLITIQQIDPAELSPGEFAHTIIKSVARDNAKVVVIDSSNGYLNSMPEERF